MCGPAGQRWTSLRWTRAESDLVAVGIEVDEFAHAVLVGLSLAGLESPAGQLGHTSVEVVDQEGQLGVARMFGLLVDKHPGVLADLPDGLGLVRVERGWRTEEPLVPGPRGGVVLDEDPGEKVSCHRAL